MGWNLGDIVKVTIESTLLGQRILNILTYRLIDVAVNVAIEDWLVSILVDVITPLLPLQDNNLEYNLIRVDNLTDGISFYEQPIVAQGTRTGQAAPSYVAAGFTKKVGTKLTRPGGFRLAGIVEEDMLGNEWTANPIDITAAQEALESPVTANGPNDFETAGQPCVARQLTAPPNATFATNDVTDVVASLLLTTQNTRKQRRT